ncbi:MAG: tripartite tricarboxylate transporter TctB family protein [Thermodesulfobacteriota bacterium]|jgi:putative tricarboxylic transport membrane protein
MARLDRIFSFIWVALGIFQCSESISLGLGNVMEPGTGFMPFVMGLIMIGLAIALFLESYFEMRKKPAHKISLWSEVYWKRVVHITIIMLIYAVLLPKLGFLLDTFLVMVFLLKSGEPVKWPAAIMVGALTAVVSYVIFGVWLNVSFPTGLLSF